MKKTRNLLPWLLNKDCGKRRFKPFKVKLTLPSSKTVNTTKDGEIVRNINVRKKYIYFTARNKLVY